MIGGIVFDIGGVIIDHDNAKMLAAINALLARPPSTDDLIGRIRTSGIGTGTLGCSQLFETLADAYGGKAAPADWLAAWTCHFRLKTEMAELIEQRLSKRLACYICSNTKDLHWSYLADRHPILRNFCRTYLSFEVGLEKPDPAIYHRLADDLGDPSTILFVDDRSENIQAAQNAGFLGHTYSVHDDFVRHLGRLGVLT
jgi:HAD superfamily hydrolase (TIGR01549 family)